MPVNINDLFLFPVYSSRADYERRTGRTCPPMDFSRPHQSWEDNEPGEDIFVSYAHVLQQDAKGKWFIGPATVPTSWARSVNIPEAGGVVRSLRPPLTRGLKENEVLVEQGPFGVAIMTREEITGRDPGLFTAADRELLMAIAQKVGATR